MVRNRSVDSEGESSGTGDGEPGSSSTTSGRVGESSDNSIHSPFDVGVPDPWVSDGNSEAERCAGGHQYRAGRQEVARRDGDCRSDLAIQFGVAVVGLAGDAECHASPLSEAELRDVVATSAIPSERSYPHPDLPRSIPVLGDSCEQSTIGGLWSCQDHRSVCGMCCKRGGIGGQTGGRNPRLSQPDPIQTRGIACSIPVKPGRSGSI